MEKIVTQDVYLPIGAEELPNNWNVLHDKGKRVVVNKKENMVVLTKEQYEAAQIPIFYKMQHFPQQVEGETFSETVLIFDEKDHDFCDLGYYDFEKSEWFIFGDMSFEMICWCYIPNPSAFLKSKDFSSMKHHGYC